MKERLKRCPFCGGTADYVYTPSQKLTNVSTYPLMHIACADCGIQTNTIVCFNDDSKEQVEIELAELWNRRTEPFVAETPTIAEQIDNTVEYIDGVVESLSKSMNELYCTCADISEIYTNILHLINSRKGSDV